jgi:hypothetical protein
VRSNREMWEATKRSAKSNDDRCEK